jgi:5,10-methylenetetrahydrofolate reductase
MLLKKKLEARGFAVLVEMEPPKGVDVSTMVANAERVKGKADAFLLPDMDDAVMRMSAFAGAVILQGKGMEVVMQVSCRDRNRLALQADLLGAHACGIRNLMAVKAEDPNLGDHHEAKPVYDLGVPELLEAAQRLQKGQDMAGVDLSGSPQFLVGSTVRAVTKDTALDQELEEMHRRAEGGVGFFVTQPLFDVDSIEPFLRRVDHQKARIFPTVLLLKSVGMARYIDSHHEDVHIPSSLIDRIQGATERTQECVQIAGEMVTKLRDEGFGGVLLSTIGWADKLPFILEGAGI